MEGIEYYDDDHVREKYVEHGTRGLYDHEADLVDRYFTNRDARVLDLGCGSGRATAALADRGFDVVGVDLSETMLDIATDLHPDVPFRHDDATDLDFPDESFDYVLFAMSGIDDLRPAAVRMRAILEAWRVLKPGGVFAFDADNIANRFLFDPTSPADWTAMWRFVGRNGRAGRLTSRYAFVEYANGVDLTYAILPRSQRRQLEDVGFAVEEIVESTSDSRPINLDPRPYYVARKVPESA
ncbi:class I SAM-dependent methyltransferase [Haloarchaeobius sp. HRN-SO-5]|uniref:class I SAM-dependent methyltransferase n=1 Tax=Haloarchaeobius sp. HRN-SO-5 TaxID=3446118 RepID=UPI003EBA5864